jgi:hypothetical protein
MRVRFIRVDSLVICTKSDSAADLRKVFPTIARFTHRESALSRTLELTVEVFVDLALFDRVHEIRYGVKMLLP